MTVDITRKINGTGNKYSRSESGFVELPDFGRESPLKNAEMLLEDDYSMIDGRINNGKSALVLADEKKSSVLEKLKTPHEQPKVPKTPGKKNDMEL